MDTLELARLQFGVTTLFHFIFVPMSIGLVAWVAYCQTRWYRSGDEVYLRMTRFWGKFMLISLAIGVVTGIVQEFQFGMNWSEYSRYVGDIFGAPLAMEGLAAFFLESTFIGLWIFGWERLSPRLHLATIWLTSLGTLLSAYFILAANSWMQHPVGYVINHATHRAELKSIWAVLTNSTVLLAFPHTVFGAMCTGGMLVLGISALAMLRNLKAGGGGGVNAVYERSVRGVLPLVLGAAILTGAFGHTQGVLMEKQEPMKMASAEALYKTSKGASLSIFAVGPFEHFPKRVFPDIRIPHLLSILGTTSWDGEIKGVNQLQREDVRKYGPGVYAPILGVTYWSFRLMAGAGVLLVLIPILGLLFLRQGTFTRKRWFLRVAMLSPLLPQLGNLTGWIFTEMGRQPWVVYGLLKTSDARSPLVSSTSIILSLVIYTALYGTMLVIGARLFKKDIDHGPEGEPSGDGQPASVRQPPELILAY